MSTEIESKKKESTPSPKKKKITLRYIINIFFTLIFTISVFIGSASLFFILNPEQAQILQDIWLIDLSSFQQTLKEFLKFTFISIGIIIVILWIILLFKAFHKSQTGRQRFVFLVIWIFAWMILLSMLLAAYIRVQNILDNANFLNPLWKVLIYDNDLYKITDRKEKTLLFNKDNYTDIGPITARFNLYDFSQTFGDFRWYEIDYDGDGEIDVSGININKNSTDTNPNFLWTYNEPGEYNPQWIIQYYDHFLNKMKTKPIDFWGTITITGVIQKKIIEKDDEKWIKLLLDASNYKNERVAWYIWNEQEPQSHDFIFITPFLAPEKDWICFQRYTGSLPKKNCEKYFFITESGLDVISWTISPTKINTDTYLFSLEADSKQGNIEKVTWEIIDSFSHQTLETFTNNKKEYTYSFKENGKYDIQALVTDSRWNTKKIILQNLQIYTPIEFIPERTLKILNEDQEDILKKSQEENYFLEVPNQLTFDASRIKISEKDWIIHSVEYDFEWTRNYSKEPLTFKKLIINTGDLFIDVRYTFQNRITKEFRTYEESIEILTEENPFYIQADISSLSQYAPTNITINTSWSYVSSGEIIEFIYDFWDNTPLKHGEWTIEHYYHNPGTYDISITAKKANGETKKVTHTLVLKELQNKARITMSIPYRKWTTGNPITFYSKESIWDISSVEWNFWDNLKSTQLSDEHTYKQPGVYTISLKIIFEDGSIDIAKQKIIIQ